jgi:tRNA1Val (adenine37-N6)-methyltransferase
MPNTYFQFKQFKIDQDNCAMKVSTEACLFGAWVDVKNARNILDIGAGTGLLSLMIAQRALANIHAVEVDQGAADQAADNFNLSPWSDRLELSQNDISEFSKSSNNTYDVIVSNPPFYKNALKSNSQSRSLALHQSDGLSSADLANVVKQLLSCDGKAYVLYPEKEGEEFISICNELGLFANPVLIVRNQPEKPVFRLIIEVRKKEFTLTENELSIREGNEYSVKFKELLQDYYLNF